MAKKVCIIIGSESDKDIGDKVTEVLGKFNVPYQYEQASAHREPKRVEQIVNSTDAEVFICVAGLAAALPGFVASMTNKPVIGVPKSSKLMGLDALLSIVQMPSGVPVATVGIDNGKNAAYLAIRILGMKYPEVLVGEASSAASSSYSSGKEVLQNFQFNPPAPSSSSSSSSSQGMFGAFPLFSSDSEKMLARAFAAEPSSAPAPSYSSSPQTPSISATQTPAMQPRTGRGATGDWGLPTPKPKEKPKGDWFRY